MPPFIPRKFVASTPPVSSHKPSAAKKARLSDALDSGQSSSKAPALTTRFTLGADTDSDSDSELSDVESEDFEDVPTESKLQHDDEQDEEEEEDVDWEDATKQDTDNTHMPMAGGDLQLTFRKDDEGPDYAQQAAASGKKGPSKKERATRILTHTMHVQCLMYHNAIRNSWICDKKVQDTLVEQLPTQIKEEVRKWKFKSGLPEPESTHSKSPKGKKRKRRTNKDDRAERDWGKPSERLEAGKPDLSSGDPLIHLMKVLAAYWKKRFAITAPGLRKRGYGTKLQLKNTIANYRNEDHDLEQHGERITSLGDFRKLAKGDGKNIVGSRDLGAQLFTALCRGLGIEARMVASLQASGFGWSKAEQIKQRKTGKPEEEDDDSDESDEDDDTPDLPKKINKIQEEAKSKLKISAKMPAKIPARNAHASSSKPSTTKTIKILSRTPARKAKGDKNAPIDLEMDEDGDMDMDIDMKGEESDSVIDITPSMPKQQPQLYDKDLPFPIYWTEAISPIDHKVLPVSPLVVDKDHCVATSADHLIYFEPRGAKADKAKQVMAYVVAHSSDGTAKDVTTRYLKRRTWPGKTRGMRIPVEKVPVYNKNGKIIRHEEYDWFRDTMRGYTRAEDRLTEADHVEDTSDLVPQQPQKKNKDDEADTLANLKSSAEWVIERHLRREEALLPNAKADRVFISGKANTASYREEDVYRRADVVKGQTAETWHKFGRIPIAGEAPMKHVPVRAVTLTRKREVEDHLKQTGEKLKQGLYSEAQTEYIIPPPIRDGKIPKNAYNNIDCFVPSMIPEGAVHLPFKGLKRICNKLEIDFAEAVVGFEFGNKMAVPVISGVVIAQENENAVREAHAVWAEEQRIKAEGKIEKQALDMWRKMLMGLRIRERVADEYGAFDGAEQVPNAGISKLGRTPGQPIDLDGDGEDALNGVPRESGARRESEDIVNGEYALNGNEDQDMGGGFVTHEDEEAKSELIMDQDDEEAAEDRARGNGKDKGKEKETQYPTPASLSSTKNNNKGKGKLRKSMLQHDGGNDSESEEDARSEDDVSSSEAGDDDSDDFVAPVLTSRVKKRVGREGSVTPERTRRAGGKGLTSPYF
jgi:xeroderma pigmentosum group C-complementing protein